jgi:hypothetical protein
MKIRNAKDFWAGLMFVAFGLGFALIARSYQMGNAVRMGPAYFPTVLGGLLAILGAVILARAFFSKLHGEQTVVRIPFGIVDLAIGVAVFGALAWVSRALWGNADYGMLAAAVVLSLLVILFRPAAKPLMLILAACLAFAYLLKPLGVLLAGAALIFIGAFGGHEYRTREVAILSVFLLVFSVLVFVKGLTLPFPIWPDALEPYVPSFLK